MANLKAMVTEGDAVTAEFERLGFSGPITILSQAEAQAALDRLDFTKEKPEWNKGHAVVSKAYYDLAAHPLILERVERLLGPNVMLWGASLVRRRPAEVHPWHTDMETAIEEGRTVSVWLGLEHVTRDSSLRVVPGSHRFNISVQEAAYEQQMDRDSLTPERVLDLAKKRSEASEIVKADMTNGEALFFDGRLWHGTENDNPAGVRTALLLQYATPDTPIRVPAYGKLGWPFVYRKKYKPPCLLLSGKDHTGTTRFVLPPGAHPSWVKQLELEATETQQHDWQMFPIFDGVTSCLKHLESHASVLLPGATPHPPHSHVEEEILVVLKGEPTLLIGEGKNVSSRQLSPGGLVYYPAWQPHTIRNETEEAVAYVMFKWLGIPMSNTDDKLSVTVVETSPILSEPTESNRTLLFEGPTTYLEKLHAHLSVVPPGGGYKPHIDPYDVSIINLAGNFETLGRQVDKNGVVFYARGEAHGLKNGGKEATTYLVFEFHRRYDEQNLPLSWRIKERAKRIVPSPFRRAANKVRHLGRQIVRRFSS